MMTELEAAASRLAAARAEWTSAVRDAQTLAIQAHESGMSESELARILGVDRAKTMRRWLGK